MSGKFSKIAEPINVNKETREKESSRLELTSAAAWIIIGKNTRKSGVPDMTFKNRQDTTLFQAGTEGYACFRIPTVLALPDGRVLAFAEGRRHSLSDSGSIDIVVRLSTDGGTSFSPLRIVVSGNGDTAGNPCPVYDRVTRRILLLFNRNRAGGPEDMILRGEAERTVHLTESPDGGETWINEREISRQTRKEKWTWYACGPCHAVQMADGRLVVPCNHAVLDERTHSSGNYIAHVIFSDDHGQSWHIGEDVAEKTNECTLAALENGELLINMRSYHGRGCRALAVSRDGGAHFTDFRLEPALPEPICQGSMLNLAEDGREVVMFVNPSNTRERRNLTLHASADQGVTWQAAYTVQEGPAAYSDLAALPGKRLGILYETGENTPYEKIEWTVLERQ